MSIEEIKDIKKLQQMLKSELELRKYTYKCCQEAGEELAKNSFAWDGKEKNLVIQAMELNKKFDKLKQTLIEIKELLLKTPTDSQMHCVNAKSVILQKCEVLDDICTNEEHGI